MRERRAALPCGTPPVPASNSSTRRTASTPSRSLVREGSLQPDASQLAAAQTLQLLQRALAARASAAEGSGAPPPPASSAAAAATGETGGTSPRDVQGVYLWGPIGSGKTMLMDLFLKTLPPGVAARREHLHALLAHVHESAHRQQQALPKVVVKSRLGLPVYR